MNNQGWGLRIMLFFCAVFILIIVMVSAALDKSFNDIAPKKEKVDTNPFYTLEVRMVNATKNYIQDNYNDVNDIALEVSLPDLTQKNYIEKIKDPYTKIECNGYVIFTKKNSNISYEPYLKCGSDYMTSGYEMKYEK